MLSFSAFRETPDSPRPSQALLDEDFAPSRSPTPTSGFPRYVTDDILKAEYYDAHGSAGTMNDSGLAHLSDLTSLDGSSRVHGTKSSPEMTSECSASEDAAVRQQHNHGPHSDGAHPPNTSSLSAQIEAIMHEVNNDMSERALVEQAYSQTMEGIRQCEMALARSDLPHEQRQDITGRMQEQISHLESREAQLNQIRNQLATAKVQLTQLRELSHVHGPPSMVHQMNSSITKLEESLQSFSIPYVSTMKWAALQSSGGMLPPHSHHSSVSSSMLPPAALLPPNTIIPTHAPLAFAHAPYDPNQWAMLPPPSRRYSEQDVAATPRYDPHLHGYPSPTTSLPDTYALPPSHLPMERSRRSSMPDLGADARDFEFGGDAWRAQSRGGMQHAPCVWNRHPERTEVTMDANMILVRPFVDDAAARYRPRLNMIPYLRDPNYADDEDHPLYSVHHQILAQEHRQEPQEVRFGELLKPGGEANEVLLWQARTTATNWRAIATEASQQEATMRASPRSSEGNGQAKASPSSAPSSAASSPTTNPSPSSSHTTPATPQTHPPGHLQRKRSRQEIVPDASNNGSHSEDAPNAKRLRTSGSLPDSSSNDSLATHSDRYSTTTAEATATLVGAGGGEGEEGTASAAEPVSWSNPSPAPNAKRVPPHARDLPVLDLSDLTKPFSTASTLKPRYIAIGGWHEDASESMEILAKFHHAKKHLVWQLQDTVKGAALKVLLNYGDVSTMTVHDVSVANSNVPLVAINFSLNARPKVYQEVATREHRHSRSWVKVEADVILPEADVLPQVHTLIFEKRLFTERHSSGISQFERLILGDPYFARIVRVDSKYPPFGAGFYISGRRSLEELRDKLLAFFETLHKYVTIYSMPQLSLSINFDVHHTFKGADNMRVESKPHEKAIAINFEDISSIAAERNDPLITREEIQYYTQVTKIGENGICSFRHQGNVPTKAGGKLDARHLVPATQLRTNMQGTDQRTMGPITPAADGAFSSAPATPSLYDRDAPPTTIKRRKSSKNGRGSEQPKNIRVAMMFSKTRLIQICGSEIAALWTPYIKTD